MGHCCAAPSSFREKVHKGTNRTPKGTKTRFLVPFCDPHCAFVVRSRLPACLRLRVPVENADLDRLSLERRRKLLRFLTLEVVRDGDLGFEPLRAFGCLGRRHRVWQVHRQKRDVDIPHPGCDRRHTLRVARYIDGRGLVRSRCLELVAEGQRSEEHTSELQSLAYLVCRLL